MLKTPLVTVGIPTFERPEGLRNTLQYITKQSYKNLEIIVSDNCSSGDETRLVVEGFVHDHSNIQYYRQKENIGPMANYKFVLEKASGEYFMWAADDDEWHKDFIEICLRSSVSGSSVMTGFETFYRKRDLRTNNKLPLLKSSASAYSNVRCYLNCMQPSLFYGLHNRKLIAFYLSDGYFDFYDCYFAIRVILNQGFETLPKYVLYVAGIDDEEYVLKTNTMSKIIKLEYLPLLNALVLLILKSEKLKKFEKYILVGNSVATIIRLFLFHEISPNSKSDIILKGFIKYLSIPYRIFKKVHTELEKSKSLSSYSQSGEDIIVKFVFDALRTARPTYLDIGSNHPKYFSNTYLLYKHGSSGVCIEPDPELIAKYKKSRPRDTCLNIGVGVDKAMTENFYILSTKTLNTFSKKEAEKCREYGHSIKKIIPIPIIPINDILEQYCSVKKPNFISLDIEGMELAVIHTFDFSKYRPEVFCIETLTYREDNSEKKVDQIIDYMKTKDYFVYADTYINTIFVDRTAWKER